MIFFGVKIVTDTYLDTDKNMKYFFMEALGGIFSDVNDTSGKRGSKWGKKKKVINFYCLFNTFSDRMFL